MEGLLRNHNAGLFWMISAVSHALLLAALSSMTLGHRQEQPGIWVDTRLGNEEVPPQILTLIADDQPSNPADEPVGEARAVIDHEASKTYAPVRFDFPPSATASSLIAADPAELSLRVRLFNSDGNARADASGRGTGAVQNAKGNHRAAGFFGVQAEGKRFVYIVDASRSMRGERFQRACRELVNSVSELNPDQGFYVFFFNSTTFPLFYPSTARAPVAATSENKQRLTHWIGQARADGSTYPKTALFTALAMEPDVIFVLSDGKFPERTVRRVTAKNTSGVVIHSIGFGKKAAEEVLQPLAEQNGGRYKFVP